MTGNITQIEKVLYTAKAHTTGGREGGTSRTSDGRLDVKLTVPGTPALAPIPNSYSPWAGQRAICRRSSSWPPK